MLACVLCTCLAQSAQKENACIFILCRDSDLPGLRTTLEIFEARFNAKHKYPYVIVNNQSFSEEFKKEISAVVTDVEFGVVPKEHWEYPSWVNVAHARAQMKQMESKGVIYGGMESYRHMCRFFSGFFYRHPLVQKYEYYWRVEPDTVLECDVEYDVFEFMKKNKKKYGFVITLHEYVSTIPSLWKSVKRFISDYNTTYKKGKLWALQESGNLHRFITDEVFENYNLCHFWSNFEIGDFSFFRNPKYQMYFDYLDRTGGFFYERWGDAPVHSIAVSLFLKRSEVHFFDDIGYTHPPFTYCPKPSARKSLCRCTHLRSTELVIPACITLYKTIQLFDTQPAG
ncbi:alpha 1,2-mannosyltransferase [Nematocida sp. AWRm77]|nr:alpha 1,2-mannosyltransferase [Nematocida sp. AWRm77]